MIWEAAPTGKRGRQPEYSDAAIQTCLTMKVLFGMALRQTTGFVESLLRLIDLDWAVPNFSTLSRRQKTLKVTIPYRGSAGPLHLLIDSTGIKVEGEGEWTRRIGKRSGGSFSRRLDALRETAGSAPHGAGLRPPGRGVPGPCRRPERLHRTRHTRNSSRGMTLSKERATLTVNRFVQQRRPDAPESVTGSPWSAQPDGTALICCGQLEPIPQYGGHREKFAFKAYPA